MSDKILKKFWMTMNEDTQDLADEIFEKNFGWRWAKTPKICQTKFLKKILDDDERSEA